MTELQYEDRSDFEDADRGLVGALSSATRPTSPSPPTTGRPGGATGSSRSSPSNGTCTRTCTTRHSAGIAGALTIEQLFDSIAIRVDGPKAWSQEFAIDWEFPDARRRYRMVLSNGALMHWPDPAAAPVDLTVTLTKPQLLGLLAGQGFFGITTDGEVDVLQRLMSLLDSPDPGFAIVTP